MAANFSKDREKDLPSIEGLPEGMKAVWVPGHFRLLMLEPKREKRKYTKRRPKGSLAPVRKRRDVVEVLLAAEAPGADCGAKARAAKALNREVIFRSIGGKDPARIRSGILSRVSVARQNKV